MVLENEVVALSDPKEESNNPTEALISEILGDNNDPSSETNVELETEHSERNLNVNAESAPEAEEEEEVDLVDPVDEVRAKCEMDSKAQQLNLILQACNDRVSKRSNTEESCHEELIDYVQHVDHCVGKKIFSKLK